MKSPKPVESFWVWTLPSCIKGMDYITVIIDGQRHYLTHDDNGDEIVFRHEEDTEDFFEDLAMDHTFKDVEFRVFTRPPSESSPRVTFLTLVSRFG